MVCLGMLWPTFVGAQTYTRTETIEYHDDPALWVMGQVKRTTINGIEEAQTDYGWKALPATSRRYGKVNYTLAYETATPGQVGTVKTVTDGKGYVTAASNWTRGLPQQIYYPATNEAPSGAAVSAVVNDHGWITAVTDENGFRHCYDYDVMGRIQKIRYPSETAANACDPGDGSGTWLATTIGFTKSASMKYGLPAGHWQQVVATGAGRKIIYFDALWRPVVTEEFDNTSGTIANATRRLTVQRYDASGRLAFESYPMSSLSNYAATTLTGSRSSYDALGRGVLTQQDWEGSGYLTTTTEYLSGFQTRVTPPRGQGQGGAYQTTTSYLTWDEPNTDYPVSIGHPEGAFTDIVRDAFGKPASLTRRNASSSVSLMRSYVYDGYQQLCKAVEPETGATIMAYDAAGNLAWSKAGATQTGTSSCNTLDVPVAQRTIRSYDARNRLETLSFPDGRGDQVWTYTRDGLASTIATYNSTGGNLVVNSYNYNRRRLLVDETFQVGSQLWNLGYGYNSLGHPSSITSPGLVVAFAPNALGQPTQAGTYASSVSYFPNGGMQQFTYGNGIKHTLTQNVRGLPDTSCDFPGSSCTTSAVLRDGYDYDAHGNVLAISDGRTGNRGDRDMTYDALDRLTQAISPMYGTARYSYDALDNLRTVQVTGGSKVRNHTYVYDVWNRLSNVTNSIGGATVVGLGYDVQGNLANKNGVLHHFDHGNRLREASGEQYRYDGHGRRSLAIRNGQNLYSLYGQDGTLRFQRDERTGKTIDYVNLNGSLVAQVESAIPLSTPALSAPPSSTTGSYTVSWTTSPIASKYQLQERQGAGGWTTIHDAAGTSKAVSGKAAGSWGYQVRACSATTCGNWSAVATVAVMLPPTAAPTLTVPATGLNGSFTVGWTTVAAADRYQLQERQGTGSWGSIHDAAGTSKAISGKAAGSWGYRVRGCNGAGCGNWSTIGTVQVIHAPAGTPALTVPATSYTGAFTASWTSVATATRYELEERLGAGSWTQIHNAAATSRAVSGKTAGSWGYRVRACNQAGCAAWSSVGTVAVTLPPASPPGLTVPASNTSGSYSATWTTVTHATSYQLQERLGTGGWTTIHNASGTSKAVSGKATGSWGYQVRACNVAGCSAWSATRTVAVLRAPTGVPVLTAPATTTTHNYTVSWTAVTDAARYELEEQVNGAGVWNKVHDAAATSKAFSGKQTGNYAYRVRGCNTSGCAGWSSVRTVVVTLPVPLPVGAPTVHDSGWACDAAWQTSGGATYYELRRNMVAIVYSGPNVSITWPGQQCVSPHDVRACNANGCSAWSPPGYHTGGGGGGVIQSQPVGGGEGDE
ncbi:hypothetical protein GCM10011394_10360 [Luteimonas terricola]|uniref:RHS repeat protein n=3 Tax=Luteimonas terricola TaxID=645597 RepID=A0ABQ2EB16_9GAMM|nr:hypothetical protein GCM10011394_10360 [Luteimonas terricola]